MFKQIFIDLCNKKGVAPTVVCQEIGLSNAAFSKWDDDSVPRKTTLLKLANYFNVPVDYLLGKNSSPNHNGNLLRMLAPKGTIHYGTLPTTDEETVTITLTPEKLVLFSKFLEQGASQKITDHEASVLDSYRSHPEMQVAVDKLLGITDSDTVTVYAAAHSKDNRPDGFFQKDREHWQKIENAPDTDDPLK